MLCVLLSTAMAGPGWALVLPFGVGTFTEGKPGRGVVYASTQAVGLGLAITGTVLGNEADLNEDLETGEKWRFVTLGGASLGLASLFVSILDASRLHELHAKEHADRARLWLSYPQASLGVSPQLPALSFQVEPF
jgi:hypothetical protein